MAKLTLTEPQIIPLISEWTKLREVREGEKIMLHPEVFGRVPKREPGLRMSLNLGRVELVLGTSGDEVHTLANCWESFSGVIQNKKGYQLVTYDLVQKTRTVEETAQVLDDENRYLELNSIAARGGLRWR